MSMLDRQLSKLWQTAEGKGFDVGDVVSIEADFAKVLQSEESVGFDDGEIVFGEREIFYGLWKIAERNFM